MCAPGLAPSGCRGSGTLLYEMAPHALSNTSSHLVPAGSVARGGRPQGFAASSGGPDPPLALRPRAMVQNCCRQIEAVACQLLPALQSQEVRARKVSMLILNEVGPGGGQGNPQPTQNPPLAASVPIRTRPRQDLSLTPPPLFPTLGLLAGSPASRPPQPLPASPWPAGLRALAVGQAPRLQLSPSSLPPPTVKLTGGGRGWQVAGAAGRASPPRAWGRGGDLCHLHDEHQSGRTQPTRGKVCAARHRPLSQGAP